MSIGNLKTDGNKGNNFPFQLKVLQGLQCTCDELKAIGVDTAAIEATLLDIEAAIGNLATEATLQVIEANTTGTSKTPGYIISSNDFGAIAIDVTSVSFSNNSSVDADISVDGVNYTTLPAGVTLNFDAGAIGNYYPANTFGYDTVSYPGSSIIIIYNEL
jgi:hypothetical protein